MPKKIIAIVSDKAKAVTEAVKYTGVTQFGKLRETKVVTTITEFSEKSYKEARRKFDAIDLPTVSSLKPEIFKAIDWPAEHIKFWKQDQDEKKLGTGSDETKTVIDEWSSIEPHALVTGAGGSGKTIQKADADETLEANDELIPVEAPRKGVDEDELVYTSVSEGFGKTTPILITGKPGKGKGFNSKDEALSAISEALNIELEKEEDTASLEASKEKAPKPTAKKTSKSSAKEPVVTVLGSGEGEVEPLGTAYKRIIRKIAKQAEKNPDVKLYLSGKTFGIGARGTAEKIDGNDVSVFNAKDIKKLLAKIS